MYSPRTKLNTPQDYGFPFEPYPIQQDFMESLYEILENKQIGIFESPTGTGKSLTLTCGALKWLLDREVLIKEDLEKRINALAQDIKKLEVDSNYASNWIETQYEVVNKRKELDGLRHVIEALQKVEESFNELKKRKSKEQRKTHQSRKETEDMSLDLEKLLQEDDLELDQYDADGSSERESENDHSKRVQIFFCSRTHSQLSQVVREIKRTTYADRVRCVSLASRQSLCINPDVKKLACNALINERCLDMQKSESKTTASDKDGHCAKKSRLTHSSKVKCAYKHHIAIENLRDSSLVEILDIEDLVFSGQSLKSCPYYATRQSAKDAHIVMLPYQMLLHKRTRFQMEISLKNSIVIIDEAHNLLDTISNIYSSEVSLYQLSTALNQMMAYKMKYAARFSTQNLLKINHMIFVTKRLVKMLSSNDELSFRMLKTFELMAEGEFFNINLFHLLDFCEQTRFAQKLQGFAKRMASEPAPSENKKPYSATIELLQKLEDDKRHKNSSKCKKIAIEDIESAPTKEAWYESAPSVIRPLLAFFESLTECSADGGVLIKYNKDPKLATMKFVLLNPGGHFADIVSEARSVIIAGGTMRPTEELTNQLFKSCPERVKLKFYDHVVPGDAVAPFILQKGPTGKRFLFTFTQRNSTELMSELGMTLQNICNIVPAGIVCFLPSYSYLETVYSHLTEQRFLANISTKKHVFREPRDGPQSVDKLLADYATAIKDPERNGALLFSVVGGKLSEGLNFTDDLGRCVIVVGMPYPNKNSPELQERLKHLDATLGAGAGDENYSNLCMKSVNQCIGRSVRHINDYAAVLLVDERYANEAVQNKLPQWISRNLQIPSTFGMVQGATARFFKQKKKKC